MRAVTLNVKRTLNQRQCRSVLARALDQNPTVLALQEWPAGLGPLKNAGTVIKHPWARRRAGRDYPATGIVWAVAPRAGGLPVGVRAKWAELRSVKRITLVPGTRTTRATLAAESIWRRPNGTEQAILDAHLLVPKRSPANRQAHQQGTDAIRGWVRGHHAAGRKCIVLLDANEHLFNIPELRSCWEGHPDLPTGPGGLTIDIVLRERRADDVDVFVNLSDHNGVTATY